MTEPENSLSLAAEFPAATPADWRKLVDGVLKGTPFERLETRTYDGLTIAPLYERAPTARAIAGRAPGAAWTVMARIDHPDPAAANAQALEDLDNGATGLLLVFAGAASANGFGLDPAPAALARVLDGVQLDAGVTIELDLSAQSRQAVRDLADLIRRRGLEPSTVHLRPGFNAIGAVATSGRAPAPWDQMAPHLAGVITKVAAAGFPGPFVVADGRAIHNAGGSQAQELAFALASAVAYLRALEAGGMALEAASNAIYFRLSADAEQMLTTAKFRAVRKLWARIKGACGLAPKPAVVTAETAWRMMTKRDAYANMLRTTIAVAAAGVGGADAITVLPHTAALGLPDPFARRIARNTQLILLEESNLARVADPAAGSGALEAMTDQLCHAAWSMFQETEKIGGVWAALEAGKIQQEVAAVCAKRRSAIASRTDILTGTNEFPDIHESKPAVLDVAPVTPPREDDLPISFAALPRMRLAEPFEVLRDASDRQLAAAGTRPKIFLACLGSQADFTARASFAKNFFEAGGIEAASGEGNASAL
ncbi:MAG TPA: methylmalonyl-CoA mutase subunit beta, partial [Xanthobacteraceae bacterium]|nr:methylmalonyl-CoA mutase subunit beta [Xanthobacteraceae bacterium]